MREHRILLTVLLAASLPSLLLCYGPPAKGNKNKQPVAVDHSIQPDRITSPVLASPDVLGVSIPSEAHNAPNYAANPFLNGNVKVPQGSHSQTQGGDHAGYPSIANIQGTSGNYPSGGSGSYPQNQGSSGSYPQNQGGSGSYPQNQGSSGSYPQNQGSSGSYPQGSGGSSGSYPQGSGGSSGSYPQGSGGSSGSPNYGNNPFLSGQVGSQPSNGARCSTGKICVKKLYCDNSGFVNQNAQQGRGNDQACNLSGGEVCCTVTERQDGPGLTHVQPAPGANPGLVHVNPNRPSPGFVGTGASSPAGSAIRNPNYPQGGSTTFRPYDGPQNTTPHPGCAAALKCVSIEYCTWEGVMTDIPQILSRAESESRVPLSECADPETGVVGKCCRDPNYKDPWPDMLPGGGCYEGTRCEAMERCDNDRMAQPKATCNLVQQGGVGICCIQKGGNYVQQTSQSQNVPQRPPAQRPAPQRPVSQSVYPQQNQPQPGFVNKPANQPNYPQQQQQQGSFSQTQGTFTQGKPGNTGFPQQQAGVNPQTSYPQQSGFNQQQTGFTGSQSTGFNQQPGQQSTGFNQQPGQQSTGFNQQPDQQSTGFNQQPGQQSTGFNQQQQTGFPQQGTNSNYPSIFHETSSTNPGSIDKIDNQQGGSYPQQQKPANSNYPSSGGSIDKFDQQRPENPSVTGFFQQQSPSASFGGSGGSTPSGGSSYPRPQQPQAGGAASVLIPAQYPQLSQQHSPGQQCGVRRVTQASGFGGEDGQTVPGEFPWMALVMAPANNSRLCAGALISDRAVLCSAHCVQGMRSQDIQVEVGSWSPYQNTPDRQSSFVSAVARHPQFEAGSLFNDMSVLLLSSSVRMGPNVDLACLPEKQQLGADGELRNPGGPCVMASWPKQEGSNAKLHRVSVSTMPRARCEENLRQTHLGKYFQLNRSFMCAAPLNQQQDICSVSLGGPMVCPQQDGRYVVTGSSSWDVGCSERRPAVMCAMDVTWVNEVLTRPVEDFIAQEQQQINSVDRVDPDVGKNKPGFSQGYGK